MQTCAYTYIHAIFETVQIAGKKTTKEREKLWKETAKKSKNERKIPGKVREAKISPICTGTTDGNVNLKIVILLYNFTKVMYISYENLIDAMVVA